MGTYRNPILPGCHPDPSICRFGDRYVLVTSTFEYLPGLPLHESGDLVHWRLVGHAIERPGQLDLGGLDSSSGLYAPTIRVVGDRLVVVCTVVGPDDGGWGGRTGHFLVTADAPEGPWSDPIWIEGVGGFDPSLTVDGDRVWLCGTRPAPEGGLPGRTEVWLAELDVETGALRTEPAVIWQGADARAVWAEGPHILPRPGGGFLLVAAEGGADLDHAVCVAYADSIQGPYVADPGNPRLTHRDLGPEATVQAVGHADLVTAPDGQTWATVLALHSIEDGRRGLLGRRTSLVPVGWADDRPLFAPGVGRLQTEVRHERVPDQRRPEAIAVDDFEGEALGLHWCGVGRHPGEFADLAARPGHVRLVAGDEPATVGARPAFLGVRLPSERASVTMRFELGEGRIRAGLLLRVAERAQLEAAIGSDGFLRVVRVVADGAQELARVPAPVRGPVEIGMRIVDLVATVLSEGRPVAEVDVAGLVPAPPRGFVGAWIGPFTAGNGWCDVDTVEVRTLD